MSKNQTRFICVNIWLAAGLLSPTAIRMVVCFGIAAIGAIAALIEKEGK